jgi:hypothetical protein
LKIGYYTDSDGDPHNRTFWQIGVGTNEDGSLEVPLVLETNSHLHLNSLLVPHLVLDEGTVYYWRAQFCDDAGLWSDWSAVSSFKTVTLGDDIEPMNGIPDNQEVGSEVDLDGNGTPDTNQDDIKSVNTVNSTEQIGIKAGSGVIIERALSLDTQPFVDEGEMPAEMPLGIIGFKLNVQKLGDRAEVTLYFSDRAHPLANCYMFDSINGWQPLSFTLSEDRQSATLFIEDGGHGDADGVQNGIIVTTCLGITDKL